MVGYREIHFNNRSSFKDFGLYIEKFIINAPVPNVIEESIPYANGSIDFSGALNFRQRTYKNRNIQIVMFFKEKNNEDLFTALSEIQLWLLNTVNSNVTFDGIEGYFNGKVISISDIQALRKTGKITINFETYPFRLESFGEDIWDAFNFENSVTEYRSYNIKDSSLIEIYNKGIEVAPTITCSSKMTLDFNGLVYNLVQGDNYIKKLRLATGMNNLLFKGTGEVEINFRKEMM